MALRFKNDHDGRWVPGPALDPCPRCWGCVGVPVSNPTCAMFESLHQIYHTSCCRPAIACPRHPDTPRTVRLSHDQHNQRHHGMRRRLRASRHPRALSSGVAGSHRWWFRAASIGTRHGGQGQRACPILIHPALLAREPRTAVEPSTAQSACSCWLSADS
jgi:hypothetical protein